MLDPKFALVAAAARLSGLPAAVRWAVRCSELHLGGDGGLREMLLLGGSALPPATALPDPARTPFPSPQPHSSPAALCRGRTPSLSALPPSAHRAFPKVTLALPKTGWRPSLPRH